MPGRIGDDDCVVDMDELEANRYVPEELASSYQDGGFRGVFWAWVIGVVLRSLGLVYVMATLPGVFGAATVLPGMPEFARGVLEWLGGLAKNLAAAAGAGSDSPLGDVLIAVGLAALPVLWVAAGVRSLRVRSVRPVATAVRGSMLGLALVPGAAWFGWFAVQVWEFVVAHPGLALMVYGTIVLGIQATYFFMAAQVRVGVVLAEAGTLGLCALWLIVPEIAEFVQAHPRAVAAVLTGLYAAWLAAHVALVDATGSRTVLVLVLGAVGVGVVLLAWGFVLAVAAFLFGIVVLGYAWSLAHNAGRMSLGPVFTAWRAGAGRGSCLDTAAGIGAGVGLLLLAASLDPVFYETLAGVWPAAGDGTVPVLWFPAGVRHEMAVAVQGFAVLADGGLLAITATLAVVSLLRSSSAWDHDVRSVVLAPVLAGALWMVLTLFLAWFGNYDD
ncbi:hypothetical protein [Myceligenerans crystallogenes]|uniref:Uncharacterized protein n=1 Tax=Myceligenerans crystallogenes TaxID=316335 RepID=A0ABN2NI84_9MICO